MDRIRLTVQDLSGNVATNPTITVYIGDSNTLAAIYTDAAGASGAPNPFVGDLFGLAEFFAHDDVYRIVATILDGAEIVQLGTQYRRIISPETVMLRANNGSDIPNKPAFRATIGAAAAADLTSYVQSAEKGVANGVATLDNNTKIPITQIPQEVLGDSYQGVWDASTGDLPSEDPVKGNYWVVSVAGDTVLPGAADNDWQPRDWAVFNGTTWDKIDNTDSVRQVNGMVGDVDLDYNDVGADPTGAASGAMATHLAAANPHPQYEAVGAAAAAQSAAAVYTDDAIAAEVIRADGAYDALGAAAAAQTASETYTDDAIASEVTRADAAYDAAGAAAAAQTAAETYTDGRLSAAQRVAIDALTAIANPTLATPEDCANAINDIIAALQA